MTVNPEQERAIHSQADKLITVAAAGSGKTHVLVQRYLAILERDENLRIPSLVAITFTRAAAREMKERVRDYLHTRIQVAEDYEEKQRWSQRLSELDRARIQTIHSLCGDILRENAALLKLDPNFRVLDEADMGSLLDASIEEVLSEERSTPADYYNLFFRFRGRDIRATLRKVQLPLPPLADEETLFASWLNHWEKEARERIVSFMQSSHCYHLSPPTDDKLGDRWELILSTQEKMCSNDDLVFQYHCIMTISKIPLTNAGRASNWGGKEEKSVALQKLKEIVRKARVITEIVGIPPGEQDRHCAEDIQRWQELIRKVEKQYFRQKAQQNAVDFDDLENMCESLLSDATVRKRYFAEFRHLLVDEFQDTNQRQWQIINALTADPGAASLFVVGDPRQSIYAFRGADVRVFNHLMARVGLDFKQINLSNSYRTHANLLDAMNDFFAHLFSTDDAEEHTQFEVNLGEPLQAIREYAPDEEPAVELICVNQSQLKDHWQQTDLQAARHWEAYLLAQRLKDLVESKALVHDKVHNRLRPVEFSDIGILFRSLSNINVYEAVFSHCGLPFSTYAGRGFYERQEIWDVINFLAVLDNPQDDLALASVLRSPFGNLSDEALYALRANYDEVPNQQVPLMVQIEHAAKGCLPLFPVNELDAIRRYCGMLDHLSSILGRVSVYELINHIYEYSRYPAILSALVDGDRTLNNLEKLVEVARKRGDITIHEFLSYVQNMRSRNIHVGQSTPETQRTVSLMTFHASKGLEFPVVVLADLGRKIVYDRPKLFEHDETVGPFCSRLAEQPEEAEEKNFGFRRWRRIEKQRVTAEEKRMLYVACTRARDRLLLSGISTETNNGEWQKSNPNWGKILQWLRLEGKGGIPADRKVIEHFPWGNARLYLAETPPMEGFLRVRKFPATSEAEHIGDKPKKHKASIPPLLEEIPKSKYKGLQHVSASQLIQWPKHGDSSFIPDDSYEDDEEYTEDYPGQVTRTYGKDLGTLIHAALRQHPLPEESQEMRQYLANLSRVNGFGQNWVTLEILKETAEILAMYRQSDLYQELNEVDPAAMHREIPILYRRDGLVVHGRIDLLYPRPAGTWCIIDYKTSRVPTFLSLENDIREHVLRYSGQLAVYHEAMMQSPYRDGLHAAVHYLRYGKTIYFSNEDLYRAITSI